MKTLSKRLKLAKNKIVKKAYSVEEAIALLKQVATAKFVESAEVHFCLNLDTKFNDQQLRTNIRLPKGTGKFLKIAVLVPKGTETKNLIEAGATQVGSDELVEKIGKGILDFDILLTTPEMMSKVMKLGKILGPRGLMPSTKTGTITIDLLAAIKEFQSGKVECRADKTGVVHLIFGQMNFSEADLIENAMAVYEVIKQNRPVGVKGKYFKSFTVCSTMGPSINIDLTTLD